MHAEQMVHGSHSYIRPHRRNASGEGGALRLLVSVLLESIGRFVSGRKKQSAPVVRSMPAPARSVAVIDPEQVRAAVTVALDSAMSGLVDQITEKVIAVHSGKPK